MSLILDKENGIITTEITTNTMSKLLDSNTGITFETINGVTSAITYINKITDDYGNIHQNPYLVIDEISLNKKSKYCRIIVNIYHTKTARQLNNKPFTTEAYGILGNEYDKYFNIEKVQNSNIFQLGYIYLKENIYTNWKSDE